MIRILTLSVSLLLLIPAAARAGGTVAVDGARLVVTGTPGTDMIGVFTYDVRPGEISVEQIGSDGSLGPQTAGPGCVRESRYGDVPKIYCQAAGVTRIDAHMGAGDDRFTHLAALPATVDAGAGDDLVDSGGGGMTAALGDGDDELTATTASPTVASGGAGADQMACTDKDPRRTRGVRRFDGGAGKDRICGGLADDRLLGGAGNDKVSGSEGDDVLEGGAGDDQLKGEDEDDTITGGSGEDDIEGGSGKDTIRARDREVDDVSCGSRRDTVTADRSDDLSRCEVIRR